MVRIVDPADPIEGLLDRRERPTVLADSGVENVNAEVDTLIYAGVLRRLLAFTKLKFSNSMIEAWWRSRARVQKNSKVDWHRMSTPVQNLTVPPRQPRGDDDRGPNLSWQDGVAARRSGAVAGNRSPLRGRCSPQAGSHHRLLMSIDPVLSQSSEQAPRRSAPDR
jgi:hypothetical protein